MWSCIEVVITGRTRNAFAFRGTWVRIPPSPPKPKRAISVILTEMALLGFVSYFFQNSVKDTDALLLYSLQFSSAMRLYSLIIISSSHGARERSPSSQPCWVRVGIPRSFCTLSWVRPRAFLVSLILLSTIPSLYIKICCMCQLHNAHCYKGDTKIV